MRTYGALLSVSLLLTLVGPAGCVITQKHYTMERPIPALEFTHAVFDQVLQDHVRDGVVDYPNIAFDLRLDHYIQQLARVEAETLPTREDRLAFWINAYNALAIRTILEGESPATWYGKYRFFIAREHRVGGVWINLYDLEHDRLLKEFRDPRIHFAIVCVSKSCPKLSSQAYRQDTLDADLDLAAREFINDPTKNRIHRPESTLYLSRIFKWFRKDFETGGESLQKYIARYVEEPELAGDLESNRWNIRFLPYDWSLNGPPPINGGISP